MKTVMLLGFISLMLAIAAFGLLHKSRRQAQNEEVLERLGHATEKDQPTSTWLWRSIEKMFVRAGFEMSSTRLYRFTLVWVALLVCGWLLTGWLGLLVMVMVPPVVLRMVLSWRYHKRLARMVQQLAPMLDQVNRSLQTGRTLGDAVLTGIEQSSNPLKSAMSKVSLNVQVGMPLAEAVQDVAELYEQQELRVLALGLKVNDRYGGSATDLLTNLITVIHEREQAARQLRAMTGETRMTAIVLAILPVAVAGYIMAVNPDYLMGMWSDSSGQLALLAAFGFQATGCFLLWRMIKSI